MISGYTGTPKSKKKNFPKDEKVKKGTSVLNTSSKRRLIEQRFEMQNKTIFDWLSFETSMNNYPYSQNCSHSSKGQEYLKIF